jgi:serine/threonine protein phosphatase 1
MERKWVIGDVHGCIRTLRTMIEVRIGLNRQDTLFLLGDLIDRGPDSRAVAEYLMELKEGGYNIRPIMGNHEYLMNMSIIEEDMFTLWMANSGKTTLRDFGIGPDYNSGPEAVTRIPYNVLLFFLHFPFYEETDHFFLVHAGLNPRLKNPLEDIDHMLWTREEVYPAEFLNGKRLVHGHTPVPVDEIRKRMDSPDWKILNIDGGCVYSNMPGLGHLVALNLTEMSLIVVANRD